MNSHDEKLDKAVRDPTTVYRTPADVLADSAFDRAAKRAILKSWEQDARELAVAESENMAGGEPSMLARVLEALTTLDEAGTRQEARGAKVPTTHGSAPAGGAPEPPPQNPGGDSNMANENAKIRNEGARNEGARNEGEGSRSAARAYNKDQQQFVKSGKVGEAAAKAKKAFEGREGEKLREAEATGRAHAKEHDPAVKRNYGKATR